MPSDWLNNSSNLKEGISSAIRVIDSSSDIAQVKLATKIIENSPFINTEDAHHTAINTS